MARPTKKQTGTRKNYLNKLDLLRKGIFIKVKSFAKRYGLDKKARQSVCEDRVDAKNVRAARRKIASGKLKLHSEDEFRKVLKN